MDAGEVPLGLGRAIGLTCGENDWSAGRRQAHCGRRSGRRSSSVEVSPGLAQPGEVNLPHRVVVERCGTIRCEWRQLWRRRSAIPALR